MQALDPRVVTLSVEVNGRLKTYEGLAIYAYGMKYANSIQNECEITIFNLNRQTQDYILTETSPYNLNRTPKIVQLNAGRVSYGTSRIFSGNIYSSQPSQRPDIGVTLKCLTGNFSKGDVISRSLGAATLKNLATQIANDLKLGLVFQAKDKNISNYTFTGGALKQIERLGEVGGINAYSDDNSLILKDINVPLNGVTRIVNVETGMIGIPQLTERGIKVKFLLDNKTTLGGAMRVESKQDPAANGTYVIYKLSFEVANRDVPFYWIAEGTRLGQ